MRILLLAKEDAMGKSLQDLSLKKRIWMNCLILVGSVSLSRYHIPQCLKGMTQNHPWSAIAHYFTNPGSHFRSVTMHSAFMALGLLLTEPAMLKSCKWIVEKRLAFFTKSIPTVFPAAPQFNHMLHRPLLPFYSSHILHNNKSREYSEKINLPEPTTGSGSQWTGLDSMLPDRGWKLPYLSRGILNVRVRYSEEEAVDCQEFISISGRGLC